MGRGLFIDGDGNSPWYRRMKDLAAAHVSDLRGPEYLSEAQISLCRRAAVLEVELERIEGQLSLGEEADLDAYNRIAGGLRRILESLGLERRPKDVTPPGAYRNIDDYIAREHERKTREAAKAVGEAQEC